MDAIDEQILDLLRRNARMPTSDIARAVGLSAAPVGRRIARMEAEGTIRGYAAIVDETAAEGLEAFTEIRLTGATDTHELEDIVRGLPEVQQFFTISGDPDGLLRIRVRNVDHLQRVVNDLRRTGLVSGTKTLIVMSTWDRATDV
ncbi:Lrp/AsnC family transcriptional regulator [Nocardioidaceae bacterium]|nr:Lrp/AsnC family transcriptional regulator [Nocardioidaceae bacterium]